MAKKKGKDFLPKKIAGVKVPKKVRQGRFGELLASPTGQKVIAEALVAAGAVAAAAKAKDQPAVKRAAGKAKDKLGEVTDRVKGAGDGAGQATADTTGALAYAIGEAARSFADALRRRGPRDDADTIWTPPETPSYEAAGAEADSKKQPQAQGAEPPL
jgi:uncharacterized protein YjbJ (UPF0337 family)